MLYGMLATHLWWRAAGAPPAASPSSRLKRGSTPKALARPTTKSRSSSSRLHPAPAGGPATVYSVKARRVPRPHLQHRLAVSVAAPRCVAARPHRSKRMCGRQRLRSVGREGPWQSGGNTSRSAACRYTPLDPGRTRHPSARRGRGTRANTTSRVSVSPVGWACQPQAQAGPAGLAMLRYRRARPHTQPSHPQRLRPLTSPQHRRSQAWSDTRFEFHEKVQPDRGQLGVPRRPMEPAAACSMRALSERQQVRAERAARGPSWSRKCPPSRFSIMGSAERGRRFRMELYLLKPLLFYGSLLLVSPCHGTLH